LRARPRHAIPLLVSCHSLAKPRQAAPLPCHAFQAKPRVHGLGDARTRQHAFASWHAFASSVPVWLMCGEAGCRLWPVHLRWTRGLAAWRRYPLGFLKDWSPAQEERDSARREREPSLKPFQPRVSLRLALPSVCVSTCVYVCLRVSTCVCKHPCVLASVPLVWY
jgi:hypothetical protein